MLPSIYIEQQQGPGSSSSREKKNVLTFPVVCVTFKTADVTAGFEKFLLLLEFGDT
jgi:hypothetical protein